MHKRTRYMRVILPTAEILAEFDVHAALLELAQLDLKALAAYAVGWWATVEGDNWQYYCPSNLSTVELVINVTCQDLLAGMTVTNERDRHDISLIAMSFLKKIYYDVITTIESFGLTDSQLRELEILDWLGDDMAISIKMR